MSFQLTTVLTLAKQIAASTVAKDTSPRLSSWEAVGESITQLIEEGGKLLPLTLETENVLKGSFCVPVVFLMFITVAVSGMAPWIVRVDEIKANTAVNVEAERKVVQLNDEMQSLVRSLKTRDQNIQESAVKIELMERRMEAVKKQADTITDLEGEISKSRKQERAYEEAMEQLQADLDTMEQDNAKLKVLAAGHERQGRG
jgi:dynactin 1